MPIEDDGEEEEELSIVGEQVKNVRLWLHLVGLLIGLMGSNSDVIVFLELLRLSGHIPSIIYLLQ